MPGPMAVAMATKRHAIVGFTQPLGALGIGAMRRSAMGPYGHVKPYRHERPCEHKK